MIGGEETISQKENASLNFLKGVACICVVWIHCPFPGTVGKVITGFARFAVPLFFAISGYFVYDKEAAKMQKRICHKIKHIAKILIVTEGLYFIWYFTRGCIRGGRNGGIAWIRETLTSKAVMNCIVFQKTIIIDVAWFLLALLLAYIFTLEVNKYTCWKSMFWITPILLLFNEIIARTAPSICPDDMQWYWNANLWLLGWPCFVIGYWIRINQRELLNIATEKWLMLIVTSYFLNLVEVFMPGTSWFYISNIPFMIGSMILCLKYPEFIWHRGLRGGDTVRYIGKELSCGIYILHMFVRDMLQLMIEDTMIYETVWISWIMPLMTVAVTLILVELLVYIKKLKQILC